MTARILHGMICMHGIWEDRAASNNYHHPAPGLAKRSVNTLMRGVLRLRTFRTQK